MCEEYIIDALDAQTLIAKREFLECMQSRGFDLTGGIHEWGEFIVVNLTTLKPELREYLAPYAIKLVKKNMPTKQKKECYAQPKRSELIIKWDIQTITRGRRKQHGFMRVVSLYLDSKLVEELDKIAKDHHLSRSELVARILEAFLDAYKSIK